MTYGLAKVWKLRNGISRHLGQSRDWIFLVSLAMCTCNVWCNVFSHICRSIEPFILCWYINCQPEQFPGAYTSPPPHLPLWVYNLCPSPSNLPRSHVGTEANPSPPRTVQWHDDQPSGTCSCLAHLWIITWNIYAFFIGRFYLKYTYFNFTEKRNIKNRTEDKLLCYMHNLYISLWIHNISIHVQSLCKEVVCSRYINKC